MLRASLFLAAVALATAGNASGAPSPRAISPAERAAVELALAYAERGAAAWTERLADGSPLAGLSPAVAAAEIAVRCGPADGAVWQLQTPGAAAVDGLAVFTIEFPSGIDETLELRLESGAGGWHLAGLRSLADSPPSGLSGARAHAAPSPIGGPAAGALLLLSLLALVALATPRRALVTAGLALLLLVPGCGDRSAAPGGDGPGEEAELQLPPLALAELGPLRQALAAGRDRAAIEQESARRPSDPRLARVADLWRAQLALVEGDLATAGTLLARIPKQGAPPLAALLEARHALARFDGRSAAASYARAADEGPDHDGLMLESIQAERLSGEEGRAAVEVALLVERGTRLAEPWYDAAGEALIAERAEEGERLFETAWQLAPLPREELFDDPVTAALVARPNVFPLLDLGSAEEPRVEPLDERSPVALSAGARARLCGRELEIEHGSFGLRVPGGAALAGPLTEVEGPARRRERRRAEAMAALPRLISASAAGEAWAPRQLRLAETAARSLARERRWAELLELTAGPARRVESAAANVLRYRALALSQLDRDAEARDLLVRVAKRELAASRPSPGTLYDLAEVLAAEGDYETAIRLIRKADSRLPYPAGERRMRQFEMRRDLEAASRTHRSRHFEIRYPRDTGERYARQIATVLEHERARLARWIPKRSGDRVAVDLFPLQQFFASYGGGVSVVGLFDGRVRVPFAELRSLHPNLVAILSHELAHALIADATEERAPKWFHEGLAQHVEMGTGRVNPLPDLEIQKHAIAFPALEPILAGFAEAQLVDLAYAEAAWAVYFIEARWGVGALHRLQREFAAGRDTEAAIRAVCGLSLPEFDRAFWRWGTREAPSARSVEVRRYDHEYDTLYERAEEPATLASAGGRPGAAGALVPSDPARARFAEWHRVYAALAAPVKTAYKPVLDAYRGGTSRPFAADCQRLAEESRRMLADGRAFTSEDNDVNRTLEEVYRLLGDLGTTCRDGRHDEARVLYERVGKALAVAAEALDPWQAQP